MGQKVHPTGGSAQKSAGALPVGRRGALLLPHPGAAVPPHPHGGHCRHERSACHDRAGCLSGQDRPQSHLYPPPALHPFGSTAGGDPTADDRLSDASSSRMAADRHGAHHCECGPHRQQHRGICPASGAGFFLRCADGLSEHSAVTDHAAGDAQPGCRVGLCLSLKTTNRKQEIR